LIVRETFSAKPLPSLALCGEEVLFTAENGRNAEVSQRKPISNLFFAHTLSTSHSSAGDGLLIGREALSAEPLPSLALCGEGSFVHCREREKRRGFAEEAYLKLILRTHSINQPLVSG